jgi:hypothetical protein
VRRSRACRHPRARPGHIETQCGFKVTGTTLAPVHAAGAQFSTSFDDSDHAHAPTRVGRGAHHTHVAAGRRTCSSSSPTAAAPPPGIPVSSPPSPTTPTRGELASVESRAVRQLDAVHANEPLIAERARSDAWSPPPRRSAPSARRGRRAARRSSSGCDAQGAAIRAWPSTRRTRCTTCAARRDRELESHLHQALGVRLFDVANARARRRARTGAAARRAGRAHEAGRLPAVPLLRAGMGAARRVRVRPRATARQPPPPRDGIALDAVRPQGVAAVRAAITSDETTDERTGAGARARSGAQGRRRPQARVWLDALARGLAKEWPRPADPDDRVRFPYYGDTLEASRAPPRDQVAEIVVRGNAKTRSSRLHGRRARRGGRAQGDHARSRSRRRRARPSPPGATAVARP